MCNFLEVLNFCKEKGSVSPHEIYNFFLKKINLEGGDIQGASQLLESNLRFWESLGFLKISGGLFKRDTVHYIAKK